MAEMTVETRRAAYEYIKPKCGPRAKKILEVLCERGDLTAEEITDILLSEKIIPYFDMNKVRPRLTELKDAGMVACLQDVKRTSQRSGIETVVWTALKRGRDMIGYGQGTAETIQAAGGGAGA